jgi:hypothetical protein
VIPDTKLRFCDWSNARPDEVRKCLEKAAHMATSA